MTKNNVLKNSIFFLCVVLMLICVTSCASRGVASYNQENAEITKETYLVDITFEGGTGKAYIQSPVEVTSIDGEMTAKFVWSSKNYD